MRIARYLLVSGSAAVAAGSLVLATQAAATTAVGRAGDQPSARFLARARAALVSYLSANRHAPPFRSGDPGARTVNEPAPPLADTAAAGAYNWSGYADVSSTAKTFTRVSGRWKTPRVKCGRQDELTSEWVGLDGYNDGTVEQDGTVSWCYLGHPTYFSWYEIYPAQNTVEVGKSVRAGDKVAASVSRTGSRYTLALTDFTHPVNSFSTTARCATCKNTSAEWIAERPSFSIGVAPLADYGSWTVSKARETAGGTTGTISSYPVRYKIDMVDATSAYPLSLTSRLSNGGSTFRTHWTNSY